MKRFFTLTITLALLVSLFPAIRATEPQTISQMLQTCDSMTGFWDAEGRIKVVNTDAKEGTGYVAATSATCPIICNNVLTVNDLSKYAQGWIHFWLYIDNIENLDLSTARINLRGDNDGATTGDDFIWSLENLGLKSGWNEVTLKFSDAIAKGNFQQVTILWLYGYVSKETTIGIDGLSVNAKVDDTMKANISYVFDPEVTGTKPSNTKHTLDTKLTLPDCSAKKTGKIFGGYSDGFAVYPAGYEYLITGDVEFTAVWYDSAEAVESVYDSAVRMATERSVLFAGSDNMRAAIAKVLQKIENGEEVHVVAIGASIVAGAGADPGKEWVSVVRNWLCSLNPNAKIHFYNMGIGSTEEVLGVSRFDNEVLSKDPDLVIMDCSVNNVNMPHAQEAYEGEITKLICAGVPVVNFNCCNRSGGNIQDACYAINSVYGVPQISFRDSYWALTQRQNIPAELTANKIWTADTVHPQTNGHQLAGNLVVSYLQGIQSAWKAGSVTPAPLSTELPSPVTANKYADALLYQSNSPVGDAVTVVSADGWTDDFHSTFFQGNLNGWQANTDGATITYKVKGGYFAIFMQMSPNAGHLRISVDGGTPVLVTNARTGADSFEFPYNVMHLDDGKEHTVTITLVKPSNADSAWFGICAVGAANLNDGVEAEKAPDPEDYTNKIDLGVGEQETSGTSDLFVIPQRFTAVNASACFPDGYLHLKVYVSDATLLGAGQIEISSSGSSDLCEASWNVERLGLTTGWNELYLPLSTARIEGGSPDPSALNYFRIYTTKASGVDMVLKVSDVYLCQGSEAIDDPPVTEPTDPAGPTDPTPSGTTPTEPTSASSPSTAGENIGLGWLFGLIALAGIAAAALILIKKGKA